jgi:hypothetical protein
MLLLILAFLSVLAPVLADTYLCPMAKAARAAALEHKPSCCAKSEMAPPAAPGTLQFQSTCDCPKLSWDAAPAELSRESFKATQTVALAVALVPLVLERVSLPRFVRPMPTRIAAPSGPPLWMRNQAILC